MKPYSYVFFQELYSFSSFHLGLETSWSSYLRVREAGVRPPSPTHGCSVVSAPLAEETILPAQHGAVQTHGTQRMLFRFIQLHACCLVESSGVRSTSPPTLFSSSKIFWAILSPHVYMDFRINLPISAAQAAGTGTGLPWGCTSARGAPRSYERGLCCSWTREVSPLTRVSFHFSQWRFQLTRLTPKHFALSDATVDGIFFTPFLRISYTQDRFMHENTGFVLPFQSGCLFFSYLTALLMLI